VTLDEGRRGATIGSILVAAAAGMTQAARATTASNAATPENVSGSAAVMPNIPGRQQPRQATCAEHPGQESGNGSSYLRTIVTIVMTVGS
jgi:hypothetical protein